MDEASFEEIRGLLAERSDGEALLADGFEDALIGLAEGWFGQARGVVAVYDLALCRLVLLRWGMDQEEADEWIDFNVLGAYAGPATPVFATIKRRPLVIP